MGGTSPISDFGFPSDFGFRISDFGFRISTPFSYKIVRYLVMTFLAPPPKLPS
jgi:hypothetical protein